MRATGARRDCPKVFEKVAPNFHCLRVSPMPHASLPRKFDRCWTAAPRRSCHPARPTVHTVCVCPCASVSPPWDRRPHRSFSQGARTYPSTAILTTGWTARPPFPEPREGRTRIARRGIAAIKIEAKESTPGPACAGPPPPAGDRFASIHVTSIVVLCPPLAGVEHRKVFRGWIFVFAHTISVL